MDASTCFVALRMDLCAQYHTLEILYFTEHSVGYLEILRHSLDELEPCYTDILNHTNGTHQAAEAISDKRKLRSATREKQGARGHLNLECKVIYLAAGQQIYHKRVSTGIQFVQEVCYKHLAHS
jgi:hypothetical protein